MQIGHNKEANNCHDDAKKLNVLVRRYATGKIIRDFFVKYGDGGADDKDDHTGKKPSKAKIPVHVPIIHLIL